MHIDYEHLRRRDRVRDWIGDMSELVADEELSAKTVNNARTRLKHYRPR